MTGARTRGVQTSARVCLGDPPSLLLGVMTHRRDRPWYARPQFGRDPDMKTLPMRAGFSDGARPTDPALGGFWTPGVTGRRYLDAVRVRLPASGFLARTRAAVARLANMLAPASTRQRGGHPIMNRFLIIALLLAGACRHAPPPRPAAQVGART